MINESGKVISSNNDVYTPKTQGGEDFYIPDFVQIDFLNKQLFEQLIIEFSLSDSKEKARDLQRTIKDIVNIHSYEPAQVLIKIISATNKIINTAPKNSSFYIKEMVNSLYLNYLEITESTKIPSDIKIPLLNSINKIVNSKELFISNDFPSGNLTKDLFGGFLSEEQFLASIKIFNLEKEDKALIEGFFLWLGVNKFLPIKTVEINYDYDYENFVFHRVDRPVNCESTKITINKIDKFDEIEGFSKEKLILWIMNDERLYRQIDFRNNEDVFKYKTRRERDYYYTLNIKPSYIFFQFFKANLLFDDYLINENYDWLNKFHFSYEHELFQNYGVSKKEINPILLKLGAVEEFVELSIQRVTEILKNLPELKPNGKLTQSIYKKAVKHYQINKLSLKDSILLFSQKGDEKGYVQQEDVYFSDNIRLPKKLRSKYPILNYPLRAGAKDVIKLFKINDLDSLEIKITSYSIIENITSEFTQFFEKLKQFILAFRLEKIDDDQTKKNESSKLNKSCIYLCDDVKCKQKNENFNLDDYEFITEDLIKFFVKIRSDDTIESLRKNSFFADSFSEIIANIFGITSDKNEFRYMLRNDLEDTEHQIRNEFGIDVIIEAGELLGYSDFILSFWIAFYKSLDKKFEIGRKRKDIFHIIKTELGIDKIDIEKIDYENISRSKNIPILRTLFSNYELHLNVFNENAFYRIDLFKYHYTAIKNYFNKHEKFFKSNLWENLSNNSEKQSELLVLIGLFEHNEDYISKVAQDNKEIFDIELEDVFYNFINENFPFIILAKTTVLMDFDSIFDTNANKFSENDMEIIESSPGIKSLLYFNCDSNIGKVKEYILSVKEKEQNQLEIKSSFSIVGHLVEEFNYNEKPISQSDSNKLYLSNPKIEKRKRKSGKVAEKVVFDKLLELYGNTFVSWKSKEDDGLHYDIRYSPDDGNSWKYVEVKSFSNGIFYLSKLESEFGNKHKENYEIWLVDGEYKIYPLKDFFINKKYEMDIKDYIVSIEIHESNVSNV